jgi:hypothetical protein
MERAKLASGKKTEPTDTKHRRLSRNRTERSQKSRSSYAATAGVTISLRASLSDATAGAGSVSVSGMDRMHGRRRRGARSSDHTVL